MPRGIRKNRLKGIPALIQLAKENGWDKRQFENYIEANWEQILTEEFPSTADYLNASYATIESSFGYDSWMQDQFRIIENACRENYEFSLDEDMDEEYAYSSSSIPPRSGVEVYPMADNYYRADFVGQDCIIMLDKKFKFICANNASHQRVFYDLKDFKAA